MLSSALCVQWWQVASVLQSLKQSGRLFVAVDTAGAIFLYGSKQLGQ